MRKEKNQARMITDNTGKSWVDDHPRAIALALTIAALSAIFLTMILLN